MFDNILHSGVCAICYHHEDTLDHNNTCALCADRYDQTHHLGQYAIDDDNEIVGMNTEPEHEECFECGAPGTYHESWCPYNEA